MEAIQTLHEQGKFEKFGLSNFTKEQILEWHSYAKSKGRPSAEFPGSYSIAVRGNETALFPTLRELGISVQAYSPIDAGLSVKAPEFIAAAKGSRDPTTMMGRMRQDLYNKPAYMKMPAEFSKLMDNLGLSRSSVAHRWLKYHSALDGSLCDGLLLGAISSEQLEESLLVLEKGPLEP
ncbi:hypothetical protein BN1723_013722, partial [Verticillium longisporum]